jgi:hypothetical protein
MTLIEGAFPYDPDHALGGRARILFGVPGDGSGGTVAVPTNFYGVVNPLSLLKVGSWFELGLTTDATNFAHARDGEGLEYQQTGELFQEITSISRTLTVPIGAINSQTLAMVENTGLTSTVAARATAAGVEAQPAYDLVKFGSYATLKSYRFAFVAYRPSGTSPVIAPAGVTFPGGSNQRPAMVATVLPLAALALEETEEEYESGSPVGMEAQFRTVPVPGLPAGAEHGFRHIEKPGQLT